MVSPETDRPRRRAARETSAAWASAGGADLVGAARSAAPAAAAREGPKARCNRARTAPRPRACDSPCRPRRPEGIDRNELPRDVYRTLAGEREGAGDRVDVTTRLRGSRADRGRGRAARPGSEP